MGYCDSQVILEGKMLAHRFLIWQDKIVSMERDKIVCRFREIQSRNSGIRNPNGTILVPEIRKRSQHPDDFYAYRTGRG